MSYVVLARKWRPQSFDDLAGQGHVATTLANAIAQNRVAHAFLFTGVRGVGKTTSARILAKALNCAKGPTAKPCQECPQCVEITRGSDVDVLEIDGASYNGVDEVRRLQESLPYRPARDRFKIFIVDEVHMLSNAAWNAFLKTLEEPPPHVKFIFATTEAHKVPVTILSRCQRYDFKLIPTQTVAQRLKYVLEQEQVAFDDSAVQILAREAAGSMRDGMSLLDQVLAWAGPGGGKLTAEGVASVLGVADRAVLHKLAGALVDGDATACLQVVADLAGQGFDMPHVARDILAHLRDLVVAKVVTDPNGLLDLADAEIADVKALAARADADDLTRLHQGYSKGFDEMVKGGQVRASLEMTLVRLARAPPLFAVEELVRRLEDLERKLGGRSSPSSSSGGDRGPTRGGAPPRRPSPTFSSAPTTAAPERVAPAPDHDGAASGPIPQRPPAAHDGAASGPIPQRPPAAIRPGPPPERAPTSEPRARPNAGAEGAAIPPQRPAEPPAIAPFMARAPARADPVPVHSPEDFSAFRAAVDQLRGQNARLASALEHATLLAFGPSRVDLGFETDFVAAQLSEPTARRLVLDAFAAVLGARPDLVVTTTGKNASGQTIARVEKAAERERTDAARKAVAEHPLVMAAVELLGAQLTDVRLAETNP